MKYELTIHAQTVLEERKIELAWLERVLDHPEKTEIDRADSTLSHHLGRIPEYGGRVLRVVFTKQTSPARVVTIYFDRKMKGKI